MLSILRSGAGGDSSVYPVGVGGGGHSLGMFGSSISFACSLLIVTRSFLRRDYFIARVARKEFRRLRGVYEVREELRRLRCRRSHIYILSQVRRCLECRSVRGVRESFCVSYCVGFAPQREAELAGSGCAVFGVAVC